MDGGGPKLCGQSSVQFGVTLRLYCVYVWHSVITIGCLVSLIVL
jgi:hypothetical protein